MIKSLLAVNDQTDSIDTNIEAIHAKNSVRFYTELNSALFNRERQKRGPANFRTAIIATPISTIEDSSRQDKFYKEVMII
jgi:hypothetical protein